MKCLDCDAKLTTTRENVRFDCGLPNVTLVNVEVSRCTKCGYSETAVPRIEELHRKLAVHVAMGAGRLTVPEVRYLRKSLGWSGAEFARQFRVTPETVSRWENGKSPMDLQFEQLLRIWVVNFGPADDARETTRGILKREADEKVTRGRLEAIANKRGWQLAEAA